MENHRRPGRRHARPGGRQTVCLHPAGRRRSAPLPQRGRRQGTLAGQVRGQGRDRSLRPAHPGPRSSPAVADGKVVTLGVGGVVSCLDAASGKLLWRKDRCTAQCPCSTPPCRRSSWTVCASRSSAGSEGAMIAFDLATGDAEVEVGGRRPGLRLARADDRGRHEADRGPNGKVDRGRRRGRRQALVGSRHARPGAARTTRSRRSSMGKR